MIPSNPLTLGYLVYLDDGSGNEPKVVHDTKGQALSNIATLTGLTTGHVYSATVTAVNVIGESAHSSPALTLYTGQVPSKITYLAWEDSSPTSIEFRW